ncbi:MAG TPA: GNAT family N-acetyltransferase [Rhizomicrobium sp.]|nr:GNAT family N-acetyltransferase [Rhizomicrobium sp.]
MPENPNLPGRIDGRFIQLRRLSKADAPALHAIFSDAEALRNWDLGPAIALDDTLAWIRQSLGLATAFHGAWTIRAGDGALVGVATYFDREPWQDRTQIGFALRRTAEFENLAGETIGLLKAVCIDRLRSHRMEFMLEPTDLTTRSIVEAAGFAREGTLRGRFRTATGYRDADLFAFVADCAAAACEVRDSSELHWRLDEAAGTDIASYTRRIQPAEISADAPLSLALPVVLEGSQLTAHASGAKVTLSASSGVLKAILRCLDGFHSLERISERLAGTYQQADVRALLETMVANGLLVPSDRLFERGWAYAENPSALSTPIGPDTALELARASAAKIGRFGPEAIVVRAPGKASNLAALLQSRRTTRRFTGARLDDAVVANILYSAYGLVGEPRLPNGEAWARRAVPSAGGAYPLTLTWVQWCAGKELPAGIYDVVVGTDREIGFEPISDAPVQILSAIVNPTEIVDAHGLLVIGADIAGSRRKYGNRAFGYALVEVGHVAQNVQLSAASEGVGVLEIGGILENRLRQVIGPSVGQPFLAMALGKAETRPHGTAAQDRLELEFGWVPPAHNRDMPFHLAGARLVGQAEAGDWCWGRSADPASAVRKAVGEAVERAACAKPGKIFWARAEHLDAFVMPQRFVSYDAGTYRRNRMLRRFSVDQERPWVIATRVSDGAKVAVLADHVYFQNAIPDNTAPYTSTTTSGSAAYPTFDGAVERSVLELLERHMFLLAWLKGIQAPKIDQAALPAHLNRRIAALRDMGWLCRPLLLGTEPVTTILAFAQNPERGMTRVSAASRFDAEEALTHALEEVESSIYTIPAGRRRKRRGLSPRTADSPTDHGDIYLQERYFRRADWLIEGRETAALGEQSSLCGSAEQIFKFFHERGFESYVTDISPDVSSLPAFAQSNKVARVLIEGLLPMFFGTRLEPALRMPCFGSERLGTAPTPRFIHPFH